MQRGSLDKEGERDRGRKGDAKGIIGEGRRKGWRKEGGCKGDHWIRKEKGMEEGRGMQRGSLDKEGERRGKIR